MSKGFVFWLLMLLWLILALWIAWPGPGGTYYLAGSSLLLFLLFGLLGWQVFGPPVK